MLTKDENELLTRVGRGTPGGELLRRYWMPIACTGELTEQKPIKAARVLGEGPGPSRSTCNPESKP